MKKANEKSLVLFFSISVLLMPAICSLSGCDSNPRFKHIRTIQVSAAFAAASAFGAETHNGSITIAGAEVTDCNLVATIVARAMTAEEAKQLAEKVGVTLVPGAGKLEAKITKPDIPRTQSLSVSLNATIPAQANLHLLTHNGAVKISDVTGDIDSTTHNGAITAHKTAGKHKLTTHNGKILCKDTSGPTYAKTYNGSVNVSFLKTAPSPANISLTTHNGSITLTAPPNLSAKVAASTHNGSIKTDLPITVSGQVGKNKLNGTIGEGEGKLELETHNGSIRIK